MITRKTAFFSTKKLAFLAMMTAACVVGRLSFQWIPNVQPMTDMLLLLTIYQGLFSGLIVSLLSLIITSLFLGMGTWTIAQLISYAVVLVFFSVLYRYTYVKHALILQAMASFVVGLLYGFVISLVQAPFLGIQSFWAYYVVGISFDLLHAAGNFGFYLILAPIFAQLFKRMADKIT